MKLQGVTNKYETQRVREKKTEIFLAIFKKVHCRALWE